MCIAEISSMSSLSTTSRPAVSTITAEKPSALAFATASRATLTGSFSPGSEYTGTPTCSPSVDSWSTAAGLNVSQAASSTFIPDLLLRRSASLPQNVVLPEPLSPATSITAGEPLRLISLCSEPMNSTSSSWTILTIICWGLTAVSTSEPRAFALTLSQNSLATL